MFASYIKVLSFSFIYTKYLELLKTYRSSPEIIDYTNKILNLKHVNAIRRDNNKPVVIRKGIKDLKESLDQTTKEWEQLELMSNNTLSDKEQELIKLFHEKTGEKEQIQIKLSSLSKEIDA